MRRQEGRGELAAGENKNRRIGFSKKISFLYIGLKRG
jgi:hypothetical protein